MDQDFRIERHTSKWAEQNTLMTRLVSGALVFAVVVQWKVAEPYADALQKKVENERRMPDLERKQAKIESERARLAAADTKLKRVKEHLAGNPWVEHIDRLKKDLAALNSTGGGSPAKKKELADATIGAIEDDTRKTLATLSELLADNQIDGSSARAVTELGSKIGSWADETRRAPNPWYRSVRTKEETATGAETIALKGVEKVIKSAETQIDAVIEKLQSLQKKTKDALEAAQQETVKANETRDAAEKQLDKILPEWLRGLVTVLDLVGVYPLVLIAVVLCVLAIGLSLTRHYRSGAQARGWVLEDRNDPAFSSLWTLTYRGAWGTALCIGTYIGVLLILGYCVSQGCDLIDQVNRAHRPALGRQGAELVPWLAQMATREVSLIRRIALVIQLVSIAIVGAMPLRDRRESLRSTAPSQRRSTGQPQPG